MLPSTKMQNRLLHLGSAFLRVHCAEEYRDHKWLCMVQQDRLDAEEETLRGGRNGSTTCKQKDPPSPINLPAEVATILISRELNIDSIKISMLLK